MKKILQCLRAADPLSKTVLRGGILVAFAMCTAAALLRAGPASLFDFYIRRLCADALLAGALLTAAECLCAAFLLDVYSKRASKT